MTSNVAVVVPVYGNEATLASLTARLTRALAGQQWRLHIVVDASPDQSEAVAAYLAAHDRRIAVTRLATNVGQHRALAIGLAAEDDADAWVCLDADLQDPPEAVPALLARLAAGDVDAVFAGRAGAYESRPRRWTGSLHRRLVAGLTGLPPDAGAFLAVSRDARHSILSHGGPSLVVALGVAGLPVTSIPIPRAPRAVGGSTWTTRARLQHSLRCVVWTLTHRR